MHIASAEVRNLLQSAEAFHAWVLDYSITHGVLRIALHQGDYPRAVALVCRGCSYFCGRLQGGPYRLELTETSAEGDSVIALIGNEGELMVLCAEVSLDRSRCS
ncbi:MAG: hypothetical protein ACOCUS_02970 [Polyangiales bacterium]